jgi:hypothetical protein
VEINIHIPRCSAGRIFCGRDSNEGGRAMAQQEFRGKTQSEVNQEFLRWLQNNEAFNVKRYPIKRIPLDLAHYSLEIQEAYSMLVEFETGAPSQ